MPYHLSIELGMWFPLFVVTFCLFTWAIIASLLDPPGYGYAAIGNAILAAVRFTIATAVSLTIWLIWALWK